MGTRKEWSIQTEEQINTSQNRSHKLSEQLQSTREQERNLVASELHDTLGQSLACLKMDLFSLKNFIPQDQEKILKKIQSMDLLLEHTIQSLRNISSELRLPFIELMGLKKTIEDFLIKFQDQTGIKCNSKIDMNGIKIEKRKSIALYRILQEALNNVKWHSLATNVKVDLVKNSNHVYLTIRDNGVGVGAEELSSPVSFGLIGMKERADFLKGKLSIEGIPKKGTTVKINFSL